MKIIAKYMARSPQTQDTLYTYGESKKIRSLFTRAIEQGLSKEEGPSTTLNAGSSTSARGILSSTSGFTGGAEGEDTDGDEDEDAVYTSEDENDPSKTSEDEDNPDYTSDDDDGDENWSPRKRIKMTQ